jgi:hypothetical protein
MKKRKIDVARPDTQTEPVWRSLDDVAEVEITSEDAGHPIEAALGERSGLGWRAEGPGEQTIRLRFEHPIPVQRVRLVVEEHERTRTQEFVLRATPAAEGPWRELARQQFNFSPSGATREQEDYQVNLPSVAGLELVLVPDISGGDARASLHQLRIA